MSSVGSTKSSSGDGPASNRSTKSAPKDMYLYEMPSTQRQDLCTILNRRSTWEELAERMGYTKLEISNIRRQAKEENRSPTEDLLTLWGEQNHTVTELFMLLYRMAQFYAMSTIRNLVDDRYRRLIVKDQPDLCALLSNHSLRSITDEANLKDKQSEDTNALSAKILNGPAISREDNESQVSQSSEPAVKNNTSTPSTFDNVNELASSLPQIDYKELVLATDNWAKENILGKGGFGTVFKGSWKYTAVAIKRLEYHSSDPDKNTKVQIQQSLNELRYLNSCRHDNILPLYGYSIDGREPCLVYQLMSGGSLEGRLNNKKQPLDLRQRLNIAIGTARGLQYLHTFNKKPLIHGDIKPANILLDPCNQPKIGDFGLAREGLLNTPMEVSRVYGTKPYLPVEFLMNCTLSTKVDTFSFGVVLFELATGMRAYDKDRGRHNAFLTKHMKSCAQILQAEPDAAQMLEQLMDKTFVRSNFTKTLFLYMIRLGLICTNEEPNERPEMVMVLQYLAKYLLVNKDAFELN